MKQTIDLTGQKFGRLKVISRAPDKIKQGAKRVWKYRMWNCVCDCGNTFVADQSRLKNGQTQSCGCYQKERIFLSKFKNLEGQTFGRLTAISYFYKNNLIYWKCKCSCGNEKDILGSHLVNNRTTSCGCLHKEIASNVNKKHGMSNTKLYDKWLSIKFRCYNPKFIEYDRYGGRGIVMCDEWKDNFMSFYNWAISNGYADGLTIERKDINGNYCPENCCWIPLKLQARNTSRTVFLEYKGTKKSMAEWAEQYNISYSAFSQRIKHGWNIEEALLTPVSSSNCTRKQNK